MNRVDVDEPVFRSELFSPQPFGSEGEADGLPSLTEVGIDHELKHSNWNAEKAGRHLLGLQSEASWGVASYGYTVYRELLDETEPVEAVYLDPRCFLPETDLLDVLEEAAKTAITYNDGHLVPPIVRGMIDTALAENSVGDKMRKYMPTVMLSGDIEAIRPYVDFINSHTVKGLEESKAFLAKMAHAVQALPVKGVHMDDPGLNRVDKQVLLEDIGHAWIRKGMPVAEIDWLP